MGVEALERLRFLASLPLAGTAQREGGGIRVANNRVIPHPFRWGTIKHTDENTSLTSYL